MGIRRKGRELALQTLYSLDFGKDNEYLNKIEWIEKYKESLIYISNESKIKEDSPVTNFAKVILENSIRNIVEIDEQIDKFSEHWDISQIAKLDKEILRIAVGEMLFTDTPPPIIMNEAIEISKKYCSEGSSKFINGILNAVKDNKV